MQEKTIYPFTAIVGQEEMKLALILNLVNPALGGVLIRGEKGTAKSTAVRGLCGLSAAARSIAGPACRRCARTVRRKRIRKQSVIHGVLLNFPSALRKTAWWARSTWNVQLKKEKRCLNPAFWRRRTAISCM